MGIYEFVHCPEASKALNLEISLVIGSNASNTSALETAQKSFNFCIKFHEKLNVFKKNAHLSPEPWKLGFFFFCCYLLCNFSEGEQSLSRLIFSITKKVLAACCD